MKTKLLRRCLCLMLALTLTLALPFTARAFTCSGWAVESLQTISEEGLIPEALSDANLTLPISRRDMCDTAILAYEKLTGKTVAVPEEHPFTDTTDPVIEQAYVLGIVQGDGNGTFRPQDYLTRQEFFVIVTNFLFALNWAPSLDDYASIETFGDDEDVAAWAQEAARLCVGTGLVQGSDGNLLPLNDTTAEQALLMFYRTYTYAKEWQNTLQGKYPNTAAWAVPSVDSMDQLGLIPGTLIGVDMASDITRRDVCYMAVNTVKKIYMIDDIPLEGTKSFTDTDDHDILLAAEMGIVNGYTDGTFRPMQTITRQEFFCVLYNVLRFLGYPYSDNPEVDLESFDDYGEVGAWAESAARLLVGIGVVQGSEGNLCPRDTTQCQQAIATFDRIYNYIMTWTYDYVQPLPDVAAQIVDEALSYVGYPYVWGGYSPSTGFDCSGLVYYLFHVVHEIPLGRTATAQWGYGTQVPLVDLRPGDLVFFSDSYSLSNITHVGIYIGDDLFVHAANSSRGVVVDNLTGNSYYKSHFVGARRIIED